MRAKDFINETPLPAEQDAALAKTHGKVWGHEYYKPGVYRTEAPWEDDFDPSTEYDSLAANKRLLKRKQAARLGAGIEAVVIKYDASHEVCKILGTDASLAQCASLQYLLACKKYANSNPYLPRVESIKTSVHEGRILYTITMEALEEMKNCSETDADAMLTKMYGMSDDSGSDSMAIAASIRNVMGGWTKGVDPLLLQASKIIRAVANKVDPKGGFKNLADLHPGNMMIRRTSTGPQLVITDPLYSGPTGTREPE
jgi:hypothetical protein